MAVTGRAVFLAFVGVAVAFIAAPAGRWVPWVVLGLLLTVLLVDLALAANSRSVRLTHGGDTSVRLGEQAEVWLVVAQPGAASAACHRARRVAAQCRSGPAHPRPGGPAERAAARPDRVDADPARRPAQRPRHRALLRSPALGGTPVLAHGAVDRAGASPFRSRRHLPSKLSQLQALEGQHRTMVRGQGSEFDSLREYVPGDDVRSIDWRATARRETVVVRTWRPERDRRILLVLDTSRTSAGRVGDLPRLEHAMDAALLLTALAAKAGDRVDFLAYDRQVRARVRSEGGAAPCRRSSRRWRR